jgi:hypothetical protein
MLEVLLHQIPEQLAQRLGAVDDRAAHDAFQLLELGRM